MFIGAGPLLGASVLLAQTLESPPATPALSPSTPEVTASDVAALFPETPPTPAPSPADPLPSEHPPDGVLFGRLVLQPSVTLGLIRGDLFPEAVAGPVGVREIYFGLSPRLGVELPVSSSGVLRGEYEPSVRGGSDIDAITAPAHRLSASLQLPVGRSLTLRAADRWTKGILDVSEVDPGAEYFFRLGRYTHNLFDVGGRLEKADKSLDLGVTFNRVTVDRGTGFFSHRSWSLSAGVGRRLRPDLNLRLGYARERVPRFAARPEVESRSNVYTVTFDGALASLTDGQICLGYRDQEAPRAGPGGKRFRSVVIAGRIEKEFSRAARLSIWGSRDTRTDLRRTSGLYPTTLGVAEMALPNLSGFERNAFYVTQAVNTTLTVPLFGQVAAIGGVAWQRNDYKTVATEIGAERQDRLFGWSVGLGRPLMRRAWIRADFVHQRRNSNIDRLDAKTEVLLLQLGVGVAGRSPRPRFVGAEERESLALAAAAVQEPPAALPGPGTNRGTVVEPASIRAGDRSEEYRVSGGDVLEVTVLGGDETSRVATIGPGGTVTLPFVGEVSVAGLTAVEVGRKLTELLAKDYRVNPRVDVVVKEYGSQSALGLGELRSPGRRSIRPDTRLIDLLEDAGGFTTDASGEAVVTRADGTFPDTGRTLRVKLTPANLAAQNRATLETRLRNGDIVVAVPKAYVIVQGEVARPGRFLIEGDLTISRAVSMGGGLTRYGSSSVKLRRLDGAAKIETLKVNLAEIRKGRQKDIVMQADDVVTVPAKLF